MENAAFTLFTAKEAERCPGPWIAICGNCRFHTMMSASGITEAKKVALDGHEQFQDLDYFLRMNRCSSPKIVVGRVPDE